MGLPKKTRKHHQKTNPTKKQKSSGYKNPGNDFYTYINSDWLKHTSIPPTKSIYGISEEIEKRIEKDTDKLLKHCIELSKHEPKAPTYKESLQICLGNLAESVRTADTQHANLDTVKSVLASIQSLQSKEEVAVIMGEFTRYKIHGLFSIYGQYENKNATRYTYTLGVGSLGLPDPTYYHKQSLHRKTYFASYKRMVSHFGDLFDIPRLSCVVRLERILAGVLLRTDRDTVEHGRTGEQLEKEFPHVPFGILFDTMGLRNWRQRIFFVESMRWLHTLNKLYNHLGLDYWRLLFSLQFILFCVTWLPPPYSTLSFQFYNKELRGQQKKLDRDEQTIYVIEQYTTQFFSKLYVDEIVDPSIKPKVIDMLEDFLQVGEKRLGTVEWLEPQTRKKAQEKVRKMRYLVAYPDSFEHHTLPKLVPTNIIYNLLAMGEWRTDYEIQKLGQPIAQRKEWDDAVFVVNAYYYGQANEMIIPSGILQDPFYSPTRSLAWNYGGLGCILCHELTHAFDREGKEYDPQGFQKRWWSSSDNRNYNKQTKALIELYTEQKIYGFPVSGRKTLSENIADIGGMGIALDALKEKLDSMRLTEDDRRKAYRDFFTSFAVSWRLKDKKQKRIQALIMDRHAPSFLRVNLVVSQFQEWYEAFDVQPGDRLYIPPEKRIRIF